MSQRKGPRSFSAKKQKQLVYSLIIIAVVALASVILPDSVKESLGLDVKTEQTQSKTNSSATAPSGNNPGVKYLGKSQFSAKQLTNAKKGYIHYESLDQFDRPQGAWALLKKAMINLGTSANSDIRPIGFVTGKAPYYHSRGHLIGRQLGGSGDEIKNLATLYQNPVNTPYMTTYENQVRAAMENNETLFYQVKLEYKDDSTLMPTSLTMAGKSLTGSLDFYVRIYNLQ